MTGKIENHEDLMQVMLANFTRTSRQKLIACCEDLLKEPHTLLLDERSDSELVFLLELARLELQLLDDHGINFDDHSINRETYYLDQTVVDSKSLGNIGEPYIQFEEDRN